MTQHGIDERIAPRELGPDSREDKDRDRDGDHSSGERER